MRIVMIGQKGAPTLYGGIERHVEELSAELVSLGHSVVIYARSWYTPRTVTAHRGARIAHTPTIRTKHLDAIVHTFTATIHALVTGADVYHYHGVGPSLLAFLPRLFRPSARVVVTFHCNDRYHQKWGWLAKLALKLGERAACTFPHSTITVSRTLHQLCLNEYERTTHQIPNGVRLPEATDARLLTAWNLHPNAYVLMASRLVKHKGVHYLIDAWQAARRKAPYLLGEFRLVIAGDSAFTDEYVASLKAQAAGDASIIFTGWQQGPALEALYAHTALLVHPSENEGLPLTVLQAMAHGKAALVSDIAEHQELVHDPLFRFPVTDTEALAEKLIYLLSTDQVRAANGAANARAVATAYTWESIAAATHELYGQDSSAVAKEYAPARAT